MLILVSVLRSCAVVMIDGATNVDGGDGGDHVGVVV